MPNPLPVIAAPLLLLVAPPAATPPQAPDGQPAQDARDAPRATARSREHVTIRVPQVTAARSYFFELRSGWRERPSAQCVEMSRIVSANVTRSDSVDFVMQDGTRLRATLGADCPALGYYSNLYVRTSRDGMLCAGREVIRSRSGGACPVERFHRLVPAN